MPKKKKEQYLYYLEYYTGGLIKGTERKTLAEVEKLQNKYSDSKITKMWWDEEMYGPYPLKNPGGFGEFIESEEAKSVARGFHGRDNESESDEEIEEISETDLAQLGELVEFELVTFDGKMQTMKFSRKNEDDVIKLCCNIDRNQLYLIGGDSAIDEKTLEKVFGWNYKSASVVLGHVVTISYFADKHHLTGPKQQKHGIEYIHSFGEASVKRNLSEERIRAGVLPVLIYEIETEQMKLAGGCYEIRDEGIYN